MSQFSSGNVLIDISFYSVILFTIACFFTTTKLFRAKAEGDTKSQNLFAVLHLVATIALLASVAGLAITSVVSDSTASDGQSLMFVPIFIAELVLIAYVIKHKFKEDNDEEEK